MKGTLIKCSPSFNQRFLNAPNFVNDFFPQYKAFEENITEMAKVIEEQKDEGHAFKAWKQKGEIIEKELKLLEKNSL